MMHSRLALAAGAVAFTIGIGARSAAAQTLLYSYETIVPSGLTPPDDGSGPDGFVAIGGGAVTQDTFGATNGTHSMKWSQALDDTFTGARTAVGLPFTTINDAATTAVSVDVTIKAGEEFVGGFASLGITEFGTFTDPDFGTLSGQAQTISASEQNMRLAAGSYHFVIPLIARNNPNISSGRPNISFNGAFHSDPLGTSDPTAFQFYINKGGTTGTPSVPNAPLTAYFDNVQAITNPVSSWKASINGNWSTASNWFGLPTVPITSPGNTQQAPTGIDAIAQFGLGQISGNITISVDSARTDGTLYFNHGSSYTIDGPATLTLDVSSGQSNVYTYGGSHFISAPLVLNDNTTFTVAGGNASLTVSGNVTATGKTITKAGAGPVQFDNVRAGALNVTAGSVKISSKATPNAPAGTSVVNSLSIANGAAVDLTNDAAVIDYTGTVGTLLTDVRQHLQAGRLTSSAADATHRIGYGSNAVLNKTTFAGQTVDLSTILIKFTYGGDSNLDGQVDVTDLGALATSWQTSAPWTNGDFNYDGFVDVSDLGILATDWQLGVGSPLGRQSFDDALASVGLGGVSVPEPTAACALLCLGAVVSTRRKRNQRRQDSLHRDSRELISNRSTL